MSSSLFVSRCPLADLWRSDPLAGEIQAREALRTHLRGHAFHELVDLVVGDHGEVTRYVEAGAADLHRGGTMAVPTAGGTHERTDHDDDVPAPDPTDRADRPDRGDGEAQADPADDPGARGLGGRV